MFADHFSQAALTEEHTSPSGAVGALTKHVCSPLAWPNDPSRFPEQVTPGLGNLFYPTFKIRLGDPQQGQGQQSNLFKIIIEMMTHSHRPNHTGSLLLKRDFLGVFPLHPLDYVHDSELPKAFLFHKMQTSSGSWGLILTHASHQLSDQVKAAWSVQDAAAWRGDWITTGAD